METEKESHITFIWIVVVIVGAVIALSLIYGPSRQPPANVTANIPTSDSTSKHDDSLKVAYAAEQNKVIGDIEFGISERLFNKKAEKLEQLNGHKDRYGLTTTSIGNYVYSSFRGMFNKNKLYEVDITGEGVSYEHYNSELINNVDILVKMISAKYGISHYGTGPTEFYKTETGYTYLAYGWHIGSKDVQIRINCRGEFYSADLHIFQPAVIKLIEESAEKSTDSLAKKAAQAL